MNIGEKVRTILRALEITPMILAQSTDLSLYKAKKIFKDDYVIKCSEFLEICRLIGIEPDLFIKGGVSNA